MATITVTVIPHRVRMTTKGIYFIMVDATDDHNNSYTDTIAIQVLDRAELDALLKAKWNGMKSALINADINGALKYFAYPSRDEYQQIFAILGDQLPDIAANMEDIQLIYASDIVGKYRIRKDETIDGQNYRVIYYLHFVRDPFGLWYIDSF